MSDWILSVLVSEESGHYKMYAISVYKIYINMYVIYKVKNFTLLVKRLTSIHPLSQFNVAGGAGTYPS